MSVTVKTIAEITQTATDVTGTVYLPISQDGVTKKILVSTLDINDLGSFKNKFINPRLDIWQFGSSISLTSAGTASAYQADQWRGVVAGTSAAATYSRQTFTIGQTDVPGNPKYFARMDVTNGGDATNGAAYFDQPIEDVILLSGKSYILSPWIKAAAAKNIAIEIVQSFGSGGSPSADVNTYVQQISVTTTWTRFLIPITLPSISGKTLGTTLNTSCTWIRFWMSAGSAFASRTGTLGIQTGTYDFAMLQIEENYQATDFEQRPKGVEIVLCQRFFEMSYDEGTAIGTALANGYRESDGASLTVSGISYNGENGVGQIAIGGAFAVSTYGLYHWYSDARF
jgi:hypothetical protein